MLAARFILVGYGISGVLAFAAAGNIGALGALVVAWLGGSIASLLLAFAWCCALYWVGRTKPSW